jgi:F-type H+-transporting ATPase subunit epsilon
MTDTLTLELVTPEKLLFSAEAAMVIVPGAEGEFGVLPQHAPLVSLLRPGLVSIYDTADNIGAKFFVSGGFAEVDGTSCTILAEDVIDLDAMNREQAQAELAQAQKQVKEAVTDEQIAKAEKQLVIAETIAQLISA